MKKFKIRYEDVFLDETSKKDFEEVFTDSDNVKRKERKWNKK